LIENYLGVRSEQRVKYNFQHYRDVFRAKHHQELIMASERNPSLLALLEKWLERTPGLEPGGFQFWELYKAGVQHWFADQLAECEKIEGPEAKEQALAEYTKVKASFETILSPALHAQCMERGERRLSHRAMQGALMILFYRDMPRFSQPYQVLTLLMDIDSLLTKWRYNHVMLVQRMLGSKQGTGGSSGYMYLRSTISDRYKVFLDLFNLSTWLIPRAYIPALPAEIRRRIGPNYIDAPSTSLAADLAFKTSNEIAADESKNRE